MKKLLGYFILIYAFSTHMALVSCAILGTIKVELLFIYSIYWMMGVLMLLGVGRLTIWLLSD